MTGAGQSYRHITIFAVAASMMTAGCVTNDRATVVAEEIAPEEIAPAAEPVAAEIAPPPPPPPPPPAAVKIEPKTKIAKRGSVTKNYRRARTGAVRGSGLRNNRGTANVAVGSLLGVRGTALARRTGIPSYPVWPPEAPSSRVSLDRFIKARENLTLYDAGQKLKRAFEDAGYLEYSYFAAPGGFVLVTRIEKINSRGDPLPGTERYTLPSQRSSGSLTSFVRGLFLDAPPGFYRYIAVVVSDEPYRTSRKSLVSSAAETRLRSGSNNLSATYKKVAFTNDHVVDALIYEFTKNSRTGKVRMIAPGRLTPKIHLAKTKLNKTIASNFRR